MITDEKITLKSGKYVEIYLVEQADDPRELGENITKMICFSSNHNLGDPHDYRLDDYSSISELKAAIVKNEKPLLIKPLYMYSHGGETISTSPYSCKFDSGFIGFVYITKESLFRLMGEMQYTKEGLETYLEDEVKLYRDYIEGNVYGYTVYDYEGGTAIDACGDYYGDNRYSGIFEGICEALTKREAKELADIFGIPYDVELEPEPEKPFTDAEVIELKKVRKLAEQAKETLTSEKTVCVVSKLDTIIEECTAYLKMID